MDLFSAIENGLPSYDGFGRKISSLSERHAQVAKAFRECAYKGVTGEAPGEDSAMMAGETLPGKGYIPNGCELISLDNRLLDTADLVILFPAPCESSAIERCENDVRCFGLSPAEDAPKPVAGGQEAAVVEAPAQLKIPAKKTASTRDEQREICRRMRGEGKPDIEIAVALWPDDSMAWAAGQERLDKKALNKERNRLKKRVGRLLPRAD